MLYKIGLYFVKLIQGEMQTVASASVQKSINKFAQYIHSNHSWYAVVDVERESFELTSHSVFQF